jgi:hypothetical protein
MKEVGGYSELMKLPMSAYTAIAESISIEKAKEKEEYDKAVARSKKH